MRKGSVGEGYFTFTLIFSVPSKLHEVSLGSFQIANSTFCTVYKDNHNLNHHRQRRSYIHDLILKINATFAYNFGNV